MVVEMFTQFVAHPLDLCPYFFGLSGVRALPLGVRRQNVVAILNGVTFILLLSFF